MKLLIHGSGYCSFRSNNLSDCDACMHARMHAHELICCAIPRMGHRQLYSGAPCISAGWEWGAASSWTEVRTIAGLVWVGLGEGPVRLQYNRYHHFISRLID